MPDPTKTPPPAPAPAPAPPEPVIVATRPGPPDQAFLLLLADLLSSVWYNAMPVHVARQKMHDYFNTLSQEDKMYLYQNEKLVKVGRRIGGAAAGLVQEIPVLLSQVNLQGE